MQRLVAFVRKLWPIVTHVRVWVPIACIIVTALLADGVIAQTGKVHAFAVAFLDIAGRLGLWGAAAVAGVGVVRAAQWQLPRKSLAAMTDAEREEVFKAHPEVRERWAAQQALLKTPPREGNQ